MKPCLEKDSNDMKPTLKDGSVLLTLILPLVLILCGMPVWAAEMLNGAGATFPYPIYSKWFSEYEKQTGARINYSSIGSGGGIRQLLDGTVDFGASDAPMNEEQLAKSKVPVLHIPTVMGAVAITYNLPSVKEELKLSGDVIADIFLGKITKWSDERIQKLNPGVKFPENAYVMVAHRSDGSGTTAVFADYLSKVSPDWKAKVGTGTALKWPIGLGGKGNEGVTGLIKQTPGAIGYVELIYAESNNLPVARVRNKTGQFIAPSSKGVTAAAAGALESMPDDFRVSITDPAGKDSYPISSFTYLLVYQQMKGEKGKTLVKFLNWAITKGQPIAEAMRYAPLPSSLVPQVRKRIETIEVK
jgi:phosphate transport system substrate-binding protein